MIRAAGVLFLCGETALFLRRGNGSDHPNEWCCPGGHLEEGETAQQGAIRETAEEAGFQVDPAKLKPWTRTVAPAAPPLPTATGEAPAPSEDVDFTTFVCRVPEQFTPVLCDEHDGYAWAPVKAPPLPLHPSMQVALDRLDWNELDIAEAMVEGRLASPQKYENLWLFNIRITGTGFAYRHGRKEFVWRDPSVYMNERFLKRIGGLPAIWEHPEKSLLNTKEYEDRVVGAVMIPYLRPEVNEVWAIARIHDEKAAEEMAVKKLSTSPGVNFADPTENDRVKMEDGKALLLEGDPSMVDHIAICPHGVWDKGGDPTGVESASVAELVMDATVVMIRSGLDPARLNMLRAYTAAFALKVTTNGR